MANQAEIIPNPDSVPGAVSSGYQAQNNRIISASNGIDKVVVLPSGGSAVVKISGPIDFNGVLYTIKSDATLTPTGNGRWWIYLKEDGSEPNNYTVDLTGTAPEFVPDKNAHYLSTGERVLNTSIFVNDGVVELSYFDNFPIAHEVIILENGTWTAPYSKYYDLMMCGKGGDSRNASSDNVTGGGGGALTGFVRKYIEAGTVFTATFSTASLGTCTFSDGVTSFEVQNGGIGGTVGESSSGGSGGTTSSGFDYVVNGSVGGSANNTSSRLSNVGGSSFFGSTAKREIFNGSSGTTFGSGASGANAGIGSGGTGGPAIIKIKG